MASPRFSLLLLVLVVLICYCYYYYSSSSAEEEEDTTTKGDSLSSMIERLEMEAKNLMETSPPICEMYDEDSKIPRNDATTTKASLPSWRMVIHGYMSILSCGILIPLIALIGRHKRFFPIEDECFVWKLMHFGASGAAVFIVVWDWFLIRSIISFSSLHSWLAVFISAVGVIQFLLGIVVFVCNRFRRAHKICGILILVASVLNSFEGIYLMKVTPIRGVFTFFVIFIYIVSLILDYLPTSSSDSLTVHVHVE